MQATKLFYCYAHEDKLLRNELAKHLAALKRLGLIAEWCDRDIGAGEEWQKEIDKHLNAADIILLLISPDFIHSDYCYSVEMLNALERHRAENARVIPIILRPVDWEGMPFGKLQALPTEGKPITSWRNRDEAFRDVTQGVRKVIEGFQLRNDTHDSASAEQALLVSQKLENLAARIDSVDWNATVQLRSLSEAIKDNSNIATWATADIHQLIDLDKIVERFRNRPLQENSMLRALRMLRVMFSFAPFIFIIFDIVEVINGYRRQTLENPEILRVPFFQLWMDGFHGSLLPVATPTMALMVILIYIVLILMTTLMISVTSRRLEVKRKDDAEGLWKEMIIVLTDTSQYLQSRH